MPKDTRKIISTVRVNGANYAPGQEDELEAAGMSAAEIQRLTDKGAIEGFGATPTATETEEAKPKSKAK